MRIFFTLFLALSLVIFSCGRTFSEEVIGEASMAYVPNIPRSFTLLEERMPLERMDVRERMEEDMIVTTFMHSRTLSSLRNSTRYFPMIEQALKNEGLPEDFKYLAVAESGLNVNAVSGAGASGLWQIMSATGKESGLEINSDIDERFNVEKSTEVACHYLKKAYEKFGSWTMAAASYNAGMAGVARRSDSQGQSDYYDLFLPEETMRYIYRIATFKILMDNPSEYGYKIEPDQYYHPFEYKEITVSGLNIDWSSVAKKNGTTYKILRILNPWIRSYKHANKSGKSYTVKLPL